MQKPSPKRSASELKSLLITHKANLHKKFKLAATDDKAPNFEYTITAEGVEVYFIDINGTVVTDVKKSDKIYADRGKPFYIEVRANLSSPVGTGTLQLKDLTKQKDVFDKPQPFKFEGTKGGLFLKDVKLP